MMEEFRGAAVEADDLPRHLKQVAKEKGENEEEALVVLKRNDQGMTTIFVTWLTRVRLREVAHGEMMQFGKCLALVSDWER